MAKLIDYTSWADAQKHYSSQKLWELFDGDRKTFNIAHECVDRHAADDPDRVAVIVVNAKGGEEAI
jgi:acetyl-CoA synthetase